MCLGKGKRRRKRNRMAKEQMRKRKHFIAVLGTGGYTPCTYFFNDQTCDTKFVQEAVLKLACGELSPDDRVTICLTEDARKKNWEDRKYAEDEIKNNKGTEEGIYEGLHPILKNCLKGISNVRIEGKDIATGQNSREIAQMFSEIYEVIDENEEIYFDITHGLRNIPMLMMAILEYAKVTKDISIGGIYYGAFEVGETDSETRKRRVPIYDLTFYHLILNWSNAANSFIKYGHADEINNLAGGRQQLSAQTLAKGQNIMELSGNLNNVAKKLKDFTASIETGRGNAAYKQSIQRCYGNYILQKMRVSENLVEEYYPFRELLDGIERKMAGYRNAETNFEIGMATIDWCIDNHMVQQGYTALEETVKTFLCEKIAVPQDEEFWRERIVKSLCVNLYDVIERSREEMNKKFEEWKISLLKEGRNDDRKNQRGIEKGGELFGLIVENERHRKLVRLMDQISNKRNDINHFGFTNHTAAAENLKRELEKEVAEFRKIQEEW